MANTPLKGPQRGTEIWRAFGPGLLFAGAAVGVSHIVQSTRGGATFGTSAILIVVLSCFIKWPAFRFGPLYAAATGESLLAGYRRQGSWVLGVFALLTCAILFTTLAAVTIVSAGLLINLASLSPLLEGVGISPADHAAVVSFLLIIFSAVLLGCGGYPWLDRLMKIVMPILIVATLVATAIALTRMRSDQFTLLPVVDSAVKANFTAAMVGWMPAPIDIAVWSSLWALARARVSKCPPNQKSVLLDFDAGYVATAVLAICFVVLGTSIMYGSEEEFSGSSVGFAGQVVQLYTSTLGGWSWPIIASAAFLAMFSTTITCMDGFPRTVAAMISEARPARGEGPEGSQKNYWIVFGIGTLGAMLILVFTLGRTGISFTHLVDFVTITSFVAAPLLAFFNHRAVHSADVPEDQRPSQLISIWSWIGIIIMGTFAIGYVLMRFRFIGV